MNRLQPLLFQPVPSLLGYSLTGLVEEVRAAHFPSLADDEFEVRIAAERPLAYVQPDFMGPRRHLIGFHAVLNHPHTPQEVLRFICKHELLHLVVPPRTVNGIEQTHPLEFWRREAQVGPERWAVWTWIHRNLGRCLRHTDAGYTVTRRWRDLRDGPRTPYTPSLPFNGERWERICPGDGAQLRLPPDWPPRPLPAAAPRPLRATNAPSHWLR